MSQASPSLTLLRKQLRQFGSPAKERVLKSFFKCGPGQYGEGDQFIGATAPNVRSLLPQTQSINSSDLKLLLDSNIHEERLLALLILVKRFATSDQLAQKNIFNFYLKNRSAVNNWDLVDVSAHKIVGVYLETKPKEVLFKLARSKSLWDRRIAIVSTWHFIRKGSLKATFDLSVLLMNDTEDLMHKACGWMLREAGKKDVQALRLFLKRYALKMPRTMLRYAIEKFPENERRKYLLMK